jgi:outer membrane protein assembly factor BamB
MPSRSSRSSQSTAPRSSTARSAPLLDPHGIYGTRTANRLRSSRRRRQSQNFVALLALLAIGALIFSWTKVRRVSAIKPDAELQLLSPCAASPVWARDEKSKTEAVLIPTGDGRLLRVPLGFDAQAKPETVLDTAFPMHAPLLQNQMAFVPCEDGVLYALDWQTKKVVWRHDFHAPLCARPALLSVAPPAPAPASTPLTSTRLTNPPSASSATDARQPSSTPAPVIAAPAPRAIVVAGADDGLLIALDAKSGAPLWRTRVPSPVGDAIIALQKTSQILMPLLGGAAMRGGVWCLDGATGKVLWRFPKSGREEAIQSAAPVADESAGRVFFGSETGALVCLNLKTGAYDAKKKIGWKTFAAPVGKNSDAAISWRAAPLLIFGSERDGASTRLVAGGSDGVVRCYSSRRGDLLWQFNAGAPVETLQKIRRGSETHIFVATQSGTLFLLEARTGAILRTLAGARDVSGALATDNEVLTLCADGRVQRFALDSG